MLHLIFLPLFATGMNLRMDKIVYYVKQIVLYHMKHLIYCFGNNNIVILCGVYFLFVSLFYKLAVPCDSVE